MGQMFVREKLHLVAIRWAEPRPQPENGRTGDKPIHGFVPPPKNRRHQSDCSNQGNAFLSLRNRHFTCTWK